MTQRNYTSFKTPFILSQRPRHERRFHVKRVGVTLLKPGELIFTLSTITARGPLQSLPSLMTMSNMSERVHIFAEEDVALHSSSSDCWVMRNGKVYNVTKFLPDHPGGDDILLEHAGQDVGAVMKGPAVQDHSEAAYDMLDEYCIGRVGANETIVSDGIHTLLKPLFHSPF